MPGRVFRKLMVLLVVGCLLLTATACTLDSMFASLSPSESDQVVLHTEFQLDPMFREFFRTLGGEAVIGPPISPAFTENEKTCQFTVGVKMCYDPRRKAAQQLFLEPLGLSLGLKEKPLEVADSTDPLFIDGYGIDTAFVPALKKLQITRFAGRPISHVHREEGDNGRIIQYFENVAFYVRRSDPEQIVRPVAYGYMVCDVCQKASMDIPEDAIPSAQPAVGIEPWGSQISRVGVDLVGRPLSVYYRTEDGYYRQVYENVVIQSREGGEAVMTFLDLPRQVIDQDTQIAYFQPVPPIDYPGLVFHEVENGLGFNEVQLFDAYVAQHGGRDLSGEVISERFEADGLYRQCYVYYCLDYNPEDGTIQPSPLGKIWLEMNPPVNEAADNLVLTPKNIHLRTWVKQDLISSTESQIVFMLVVQHSDQSPIPDLTSTLKVYLLDGSTREYLLPMTNEQGQADVQIDPIEGQNGKIIPYTVCLDIDTDFTNCVKDSFMIWGNP